MIDKIIVPSSVHVMVGTLVLITTLASMLLMGYLTWRGRPISTMVRGVLIFTQLVLVVQILIGIKLLDQGAGPLQLYIHYVGGLAPLAFFLGLSWLPIRSPRVQTWMMTTVTVLAFIFALMTFTIGQAYVAGSLS